MRDLRIISATASSDLPGGVKWVRSFGWEGQQNGQDNTLSFITADYDFLKTYRIKIIEGRDFSDSFVSDSGRSYILNKQAVEKLGWKSALGKRINEYGAQAGEVIGVVEDFHFKSLHNRIEPLVIYNRHKEFSYFSLKIRGGNILSLINSIEQTWRSFSPDKPFEFFFLDDYLNKLYQNEQTTGKIFNCFSCLAIFVACLGLFGLAAFNSENRTKEIGIRKVLGSTVSSIILLLSYDLARIVLIANLFAWPVAYYSTSKWLQDFAYHTQISWWVFLWSGIFTTTVAFLTVSFHAVRAARANPVDSLKYE